MREEPQQPATYRPDQGVSHNGLIPISAEHQRKLERLAGAISHRKRRTPIQTIVAKSSATIAQSTMRTVGSATTGYTSELKMMRQLGPVLAGCCRDNPG